MVGINLKSMSLDELWTLHETVCSTLAIRLEAQKRQIEKRLGKLGRSRKTSSGSCQRRPYPKVYPKFRNPKPPHETWSGRGRQPHWVSEMLDAGNSTADIRITETV
jgi:DNA-binding protein H-NS